MPNHVTNRLTITGNAESIAELFAGCFRKEKREIPDFWHNKANDSSLDSTERQEWIERISENEASEAYDVFDFNMIIPIPVLIQRGHLLGGSRAESTGRNWYAFNTERWGTKWNAYDLDIVEHTEEKLIFKFDTAWSLPDPIIKELVRWFPELSFFHEFYDEGEWFYGDRTYSSGKVIDNCLSGDSQTGEKATEVRRRLCIELKGYDPDDNNDGE